MKCKKCKYWSTGCCNFYLETYQRRQIGKKGECLSFTPTIRRKQRAITVGKRNKLGHRYLTKDEKLKLPYIVQIKQIGVYSHYATLEEAIQERNKVLEREGMKVPD